MAISRTLNRPRLYSKSTLLRFFRGSVRSPQHRSRALSIPDHVESHRGRNTSNTPPNPTENIGPVYIDDIYVDQSGQNLVNPMPEPEGMLLAILSAATAPQLVRRLKSKYVPAATQR